MTPAEWYREGQDERDEQDEYPGCPDCQGTGRDNWFNIPGRCPACKGTGLNCYPKETES